ncbi:MAG TPA: hypothetical protein VFG71_11260, partial [Nitrospiraceae bacterium]|nr:hypothetical protein [Nitrospiraceae bacterium]
MLIRRIQGLLLALAVISGTWHIMLSVNPPPPHPVSWLWFGFLIGMPILLMILMGFRPRWVVMAVVIYATIGLALDIATLVQELSRPQEGSLVVG